MRFGPVVAAPDFGNQRNIIINDIFHNLFNQCGSSVDFAFRRFKNKFVMDLKKHFCFQPGVSQSLNHLVHGQFDNIGGAALNLAR